MSRSRRNGSRSQRGSGATLKDIGRLIPRARLPGAAGAIHSLATRVPITTRSSGSRSRKKKK